MDLDVVFLYDDTGEADPYRAQEAYAAFVRKLITWLTLRTAAGELFDIDTALRPNGNSGLLVTSIDSFERYQRGRGSNTFQSPMTRAAGPADRMTTRSDSAIASSRSWVTNSTAFLSALHRSSSRLPMICRVWASSGPNGSSIRSILGCRIRT